MWDPKLARDLPCRSTSPHTASSLGVIERPPDRLNRGNGGLTQMQTGGPPGRGRNGARSRIGGSIPDHDRLGDGQNANHGQDRSTFRRRATFGFRYRIESTPTKRMTSQHATDRQPASAPRTVPLQRLDAILAARRQKLTPPQQQRPKQELIQANQQDETTDDRRRNNRHTPPGERTRLTMRRRTKPGRQRRRCRRFGPSFRAMVSFRARACHLAMPRIPSTYEPYICARGQPTSRIPQSGPRAWKPQPFTRS
jgi:hypothetical protein